MKDITLPLSGGWVLVKRRLPTEIQVPVMSIFYAMPGRVFVEGTTTIGRAFDFGAHYDQRDLLALYRLRRGSGALQPSEIERAEKIDAEYRDHEGVSLCLEQRVRINAPDGTVSLEPHEWSPIPDIEPYFDAIGDEQGFILHEYGATRKVSGKLEEQIFYMGTRGIKRARALALLMGEAKRPDMVWLEPTPALARIFVRAA